MAASVAAARARLGHLLPALRTALRPQLGHRGFRRPGRACEDRRRGRGRFRGDQPGARAVSCQPGPLQPVLALEPPLPEPALHRARPVARRGRASGLGQLRAAETLDYAAVARAKVPALRAAFDSDPGHRRARRVSARTAARRCDCTRSSRRSRPIWWRLARVRAGAAGRRRFRIPTAKRRQTSPGSCRPRCAFTPGFR